MNYTLIELYVRSFKRGDGLSNLYDVLLDYSHRTSTNTLLQFQAYFFLKILYFPLLRIVYYDVMTLNLGQL